MLKIKIIKFIDKYIGSVVCLILSFSKLFSSKKHVKIKRILVIQLWGIGESILTLPAINSLRKKFLNSNIDILVTERNKDVYYKNKDVDRIITIKLN